MADLKNAILSALKSSNYHMAIAVIQTKKPNISELHDLWIFLMHNHTEFTNKFLVFQICNDINKLLFSINPEDPRNILREIAVAGVRKWENNLEKRIFGLCEKFLNKPAMIFTLLKFFSTAKSFYASFIIQKFILHRMDGSAKQLETTYETWKNINGRQETGMDYSPQIDFSEEDDKNFINLIRNLEVGPNSILRGLLNTDYETASANWIDTIDSDKMTEKFKNLTINFLIDVYPYLLRSPRPLSAKKFNPTSKELNEKLAILVVGQLRCFERNSKFLEFLGRKFKLFVMTDKNSYSQGEYLRESTGAVVRYLEDLPEALEQDRWLQDKGFKTWHQWLKLKCAIEAVENYELENEIYFRYFIKIRTDSFYPNLRRIDPDKLSSTQDCFFCDTDRTFMGKREAFMPLKNIFNYGLTYCLGRMDEFHPINGDQLKNSDPGAIRWHAFGLPQTSKAGQNWIDLRQLTRQDRYDYIVEYTDELNISGNSLRFRQEQNLFFEARGDKSLPSETIFARYLNLLGVPAKRHSLLSGFTYTDRDRGR